MEKQKILNWSVSGLVMALLFACLWAPDAQKVLARIFVWDQFRNWDAAIMMPGWAYMQGAGLNADIFSPWGMGAVMFISQCAHMLGGFDQARVLFVMMAMVIVYYTALYGFLRAWLGCALLAAALTALAVKLQMFHSGTSPLIWIFPQDTPLRHWLDLPVLWCLWRHSVLSARKYLDLAACGIGITLVWSLGVGLCLLVAFWVYLFVLSAPQEDRAWLLSCYEDLRKIILIGLLPLGSMILVLFLLQGGVVFQAQFWSNMAEPLSLFLRGSGTLSFYACLYDRHFFAFIVSLIIPVIYVGTLIMVKDKFLSFISIYGLGMYTFYLAHSSTSHYYAVGIPLVMVIGFWISRVVRRGALVLAILAWAALLSNILFIHYPNIFNISRMDWRPEVSAWHSQNIFDKDAKMIARLTLPADKAAVISSFETQILMQAKRKSFFYYAPVVSSSGMDTNAFAGTIIISRQRLDKTIGQIAAGSPEYIFIERKLFAAQWPPEYAQAFGGIIQLLGYIKEHYVPQEQGQYLMVLRRQAK